MSDAVPPGTLSAEQLFRQYAPFVSRFLLRMGVPPAHVEDALQDVFLVVHRHGGYRPGIARPTSYLGNLAIHAALKHRRRQHVAHARHSELAVEDFGTHGSDPSRALENQEDLRRLQAALDRLPDDLRIPLVLADIEGESGLSIASALGLPLGTVYWRLHEARKRFVSALKALDTRADVSRRPAWKRAARLPTLGMFMIFGTHTTAAEEDAAYLLRLGRDQFSAHFPLEPLLAKHRQLIRTGAPLPPWAAECATQTASWSGLVGIAALPGALAVLSVISAVVLLRAAPPAPPTLSQPTMNTQLVAQSIASAPPPATQPSAVDPARAASPARHTPIARRPAPAARRTRAQPVAAESAPDIADRTPIETVSASAPQPSAAVTTLTAVTPALATQTAAAPAGQTGSLELQEMNTLARAEHWLTLEPARALTLARAMKVRYPQGYFDEERSYIEVMALLALGRTSEARASAKESLRRYPDGPYSRRVRETLTERTTEVR